MERCAKIARNISIPKGLLPVCNLCLPPGINLCYPARGVESIGKKSFEPEMEAKQASFAEWCDSCENNNQAFGEAALRTLETRSPSDRQEKNKSKSPSFWKTIRVPSIQNFFITVETKLEDVALVVGQTSQSSPNRLSWQVNNSGSPCTTNVTKP